MSIASLAVAAMVLAITSSPAGASLIDVQPTDEAISVDETTSIVVSTDAPGRTVIASIEPVSDGGAVLVDADGSVVTQLEVVTTAFGYDATGTAIVTVQGTAAGEVKVLLTDAESGATLSASLTVDDTTPPAPAPGFSVEIPAGGVAISMFQGSLSDFKVVPGMRTCAMTMGGSFHTYVYGARDFVNAQFVANFESPQLVVCRGE